MPHSDSPHNDSLPKERSAEEHAAEGLNTQQTLYPDDMPGEALTDHPADTAHYIESLPEEQRLDYVRSLETDAAAPALAEMERHDKVQLVRSMQPEEAADIVSAMDYDDAVDLMHELEEEHRSALMARLETEDAHEIESLMRYDPDTAGGVMNTEILLLDDRLTADQAVQLIRHEIKDKEIPYYAYVVDEDDKLLGVLSLRVLLMSRRGAMLGDLIHEQDVISVLFDVDKEEVSRIIGHYNFLAIPVVDYENRLLGVVTVDDVLDIIQEEATEDMQSMVGAGSDETLDSPWTYSFKQRVPWLVVNMGTSAVSAYMVHLFEGTIAQMAILAVLMPMVANQAGNTGQQSLAVMLRHLAVEKFESGTYATAILREGRICALNAAVVATIVWFGIFFLTGVPALASVMAGALVADMFLGALAGISIPLILRRLGRDPAQASSIFLTMLTDSFGFFCFLGLAWAFLL